MRKNKLQSKGLEGAAMADPEDLTLPCRIPSPPDQDPTEMRKIELQNKELKKEAASVAHPDQDPTEMRKIEPQSNESKEVTVVVQVLK